MACLAWTPSADAARTLYVTALGSGDGTGGGVTAHAIGADGALTPIGEPLSWNTDLNAATITPSSRYLYAGEPDFAAILRYAVSPGGWLTLLPGGPTPAASGVAGAAPTPDGRMLYVTGEKTSRYLVAPDGVLDPRLDFDVPARGLGITPDGSRLFVAGNSIQGFDIGADGNLAPLASSPGPPAGAASGWLPTAVEIAPDGRHLYAAYRYVSGYIDNCIPSVGHCRPPTPVYSDGGVAGYEIGADGSLTEVPGSPVAVDRGVTAIEIGPAGRDLFAAGGASGGTVSAFTIGADGSLTDAPGSPIGGDPAASSATVSPDGRFLYVANRRNPGTISAFSVAGDGAIAPLAGSPFAAGVGNPGSQSLVIAPDQPPKAKLVASPGPPGRSTSFDARQTTDPDGTPQRFDWTFGDGSTLADGGPTPTHVYAKAGDYEATVVVTDDEGCSTRYVSTGQTPTCNGSGDALARASLLVSRGVSISGAGAQRLGRAVRVKAVCDVACELVGSGKLLVDEGSGKGPNRAPGSKRFRLGKANAHLDVAGSAKLKLRISGAARRAASAALRSEGRASARVTVKATHGAERTSAKRTVKLKP